MDEAILLPTVVRIPKALLSILIRKTLRFRWICLSSLIIIFIICLLSSITLLFNAKKRDARYFRLRAHPKYYDDDSHSEWAFNITKTYDTHLLSYYLEPNRTLANANAIGPGENGTAFIPSNKTSAQIDRLMKTHHYNLFASDTISFHRTLPDLRSAKCQYLYYPRKLPKTSLIIIFHNEAWSMLLRTIWSVIDRSPRELIEEVILIDDASTSDVLKKPLDDYISSFPVPVKVIRTNRREGLIRARLIGAYAAKGSVLTFFDSHIECADGCLIPLLARIASDRSVVAVPIVDRIVTSGLSYEPYFKNDYIVNFRWHLLFNLMPVPERERIRTNYDETAPLRTPTHIGCAFAIDREFFFEIGSYDDLMLIWGSENLEMAIRVWQCGGSMEILPCSHVGHLFRVSTYSFNGDASLIITRNDVRLAEVWLDDYKKFFYAAKRKAKHVDPGNLTDRINLRKRLKCKSFRWYLERVYPESKMLDNFTFLGEMISEHHGKCLDIMDASLGCRFDLNGCHQQGGNQFFAFTTSGQIVTSEEYCVGLLDDKRTVTLVKCLNYDTSQFWSYDNENKWIVNRKTNQCMQGNIANISLVECNSRNSLTQWNLRLTV